jgi:DNA-directed RNA polymerase sigma subunit (sigma70/sigma32)
MRWPNKITDKKKAYEFVELNRSKLTLDEIGERLNVTRQRVSQMCKDLGLNVKHSKWRQVKSNSLPMLN